MGAMCSCFQGGGAAGGAGEAGGELQNAALLALVEQLYGMLRADPAPALLQVESDDSPPPLSPAAGPGGADGEQDHQAATTYPGFPKETMMKDITSIASLSDLNSLLSLAARELNAQATVLDLSAPLHIVGDIHGQFQDLLRIFDRIGYPPQKRYLFLGDYVDRGPHGLEVMALLLSLKILYPESVYLLRGNHECEGVSVVYGFYEECKTRYRASLWRNFIHVFDAMPIAAIVDIPMPSHSSTSITPARAESIHEEEPTSGSLPVAGPQRLFCVHAGISPALDDLDALRAIKRPCKVHSDQIVSDLLWSDPGRKQSGWAYGDRGVSCTYGIDVAKQFLETNQLGMLIRAHEVVDNGYQVLGDGDGVIVTVFSVPGYAGVCTNDAAVLEVTACGEKRWHVLPFADKPKARPATGLEMPGKRDSMVLHNTNKELTELLEQDRSLPRSATLRSGRLMARVDSLIEKAQDVAESIVGAATHSVSRLGSISRGASGLSTFSSSLSRSRRAAGARPGPRARPRGDDVFSPDIMRHLSSSSTTAREWQGLEALRMEEEKLMADAGEGPLRPPADRAAAARPRRRCGDAADVTPELRRGGRTRGGKDAAAAALCGVLSQHWWS
eukprot:jgi/Tetstr1/444000/TSEL_031941.t1